MGSQLWIEQKLLQMRIKVELKYKHISNQLYMVIKDKDAFIFEENDSIFLFIYMKLNEAQLQKALPISYIENSDKCYLS